MMDLTKFKASLKDSKPPQGINKLLEAMWYDGKGDWETSHAIAQDINTKDGAWIHAYLHRKEGDDGNAGYWYSKAGKVFPSIGLDQEWEQICSELLSENRRSRSLHIGS